MSYDDEQMRRKLKAEIDRMSSAQLNNFRRSENSFWEWIKRTARRIWDVVVDSAITAAGKWLWGLIFG